MNLFVSSNDIRGWASRIPARSTLPHLCRQLIHATLRNATKVDFPAYESVQRPGFDGEVICDVANSWVPSGRSAWELSTETGVKGKADKDYEDRTTETPPEERLQTTYVALTARHWREQKPMGNLGRRERRVEGSPDVRL